MSIDIKNCFTYDGSTGAIAQAFTGTASSTNVVKSASAGLHHGHGPGSYLIALCTVSFNTLTTLTLTVRDDSAEGMGSPRIVMTTQAIVLANLVAGNCVLNAKMPGLEYQQFLDMNFTVGGSNPSAGSLICWISESPWDGNDVGVSV